MLYIKPIENIGNDDQLKKAIWAEYKKTSVLLIQFFSTLKSIMRLTAMSLLMSSATAFTHFILLSFGFEDANTQTLEYLILIVNLTQFIFSLCFCGFFVIGIIANEGRFELVAKRKILEQERLKQQRLVEAMRIRAIVNDVLSEKGVKNESPSDNT